VSRAPPDWRGIEIEDGDRAAALARQVGAHRLAHHAESDETEVDDTKRARVTHGARAAGT
jgi:uncharacterized Rossmann fold enzyme